MTNDEIERVAAELRASDRRIAERIVTDRELAQWQREQDMLEHNEEVEESIERSRSAWATGRRS